MIVQNNKLKTDESNNKYIYTILFILDLVLFIVLGFNYKSKVIVHIILMFILFLNPILILVLKEKIKEVKRIFKIFS